jgi:hypothetical protein
MSKKVAVLFSSGLDSTYLVWKNLKEGNEVTPVYFEINNNENKTIMEKNRIELLVKEFNIDTELKSRVNRVEYAIDVGVVVYNDKLYFKQIPIWLLGLIYIQGLDVDEIQIGYVANDDAIPYLNDIKKIYKSYQPICEKLIPLTFPLTKTKKCDMAKLLPKQYMNLIYTCENPRIIDSTRQNEKIEYEPCCNCVPCKLIISSNYYETGEFSEIYKEKMINNKIQEVNKLGYKVVDKEDNNYWDKYRKAEESILYCENVSDFMNRKSDRISISLEKSHVVVGSENFI